MAYSSSTRAAFGEALSWAAAGGICILAFMHFDSLRGLVSGTLGVAAPPVSAPAAGVAQSHGAAGRDREHRALGSGATVELRAGEGGHFHANAELNGRSIPVLVDTGATLVAMTHEDAQRAGIFLRPSDYTATVQTANGVARVAPVTIGEVSIGPITVRNVPGAVLERGKLSTTLLGMSFLSRLDRVDMRSGVMVLAD